MAISKRLRFEVLRRDNHTCRYCGRSAPDVVLTVDHVVAVTLGGSDDPTNLVTACAECNVGKSSTTASDELVAEVRDDVARWKEAIRIAGEIRIQGRGELEGEVQKFKAAWDEWHILTPSGRKTKKTVPLPDDWRQAVENYLEQGVPIEEMVRLVKVAMQAKTRAYIQDSVFRYFVGCCKNVLTKIQADAREILGDQAQPDGDAARPN